MPAAPKPAVIVDEAYRAWIRRQPCLVTGYGLSEAAHVRVRQHGDDRNLVPLTRRAHEELHHVGIRTFERRHGVDLKLLAGQYWDCWLATEKPDVAF